MIRSARLIAAGIIVAGAALVGCGSDDDSSSNDISAPTSTAQTSAAPVETDEVYGGGAPATSAGSTGETTAPAAGGATLTISGFAFSPLTAAAGETITITNDDSAKHTVTADDDSFSVEVPGGGTAELVIDAAGTYAIHCNIHPQMSGEITVN